MFFTREHRETLDVINKTIKNLTDWLQDLTSDAQMTKSSLLARIEKLEKQLKQPVKVAKKRVFFKYKAPIKYMVLRTLVTSGACTLDFINNEIEVALKQDVKSITVYAQLKDYVQSGHIVCFEPGKVKNTKYQILESGIELFEQLREVYEAKLV